MKLVIFDMDGVIIDSEPLYVKTDRILFEKYKIDIEKEDISSFVGKSNYDIWFNLKNKYLLEDSLDNILEYVNYEYSNVISSLKEIPPINGIVELIQDLKENNVNLAVASSNTLNNIEHVLDIANLKGYFKAVISGDMVVNSKPNPDIFLKASSTLNINPEESIVIEDSDNGILAAKRASMKVVGYKNPNTLCQTLEMSDLIIDNFHNLNYKILNDL